MYLCPLARACSHMLYLHVYACSRTEPRQLTGINPSQTCVSATMYPCVYVWVQRYSLAYAWLRALIWYTAGSRWDAPANGYGAHSTHDKYMAERALTHFGYTRPRRHSPSALRPPQSTCNTRANEYATGRRRWSVDVVCCCRCRSTGKPTPGLVWCCCVGVWIEWNTTMDIVPFSVCLNT